MIDDVRRRHRRVRVDCELEWEIEAQGLSGRGTLLDVSRLGACFRLDGMFAGQSATIFTLHSPQLSDLPRHGRLRWYRRMQGRAPVFVCGVLFLEEGVNQVDWITWIQQRTLPDRGSPAS